MFLYLLQVIHKKNQINLHLVSAMLEEKPVLQLKETTELQQIKMPNKS